MSSPESATVVETERLVLRRPDSRDAAFVLRLLNEPAFLEHIGDRGVRDMDDALRYIDDSVGTHFRRHGYGMCTVVDRGTGDPIGMCGLVKRDALPRPDLGFAFLAEFCAKGYGYESSAAVMDYARETLRLDRLLALVSPENLPSMKLLSKLGFVREGAVRMKKDEDPILLLAMELA